MNDCAANQLSDSIKDLTHELRATREHGYGELKKGLLAIEKQLAHLERNTMSAISDFAAKQNTFNDRQDAAVTALTDDVQVLNDKITELQNSPGQITPEDQALLDAIQARAESATAKLEALDALTPPKPPTA